MSVQSIVKQQLAFWHNTVDSILSDCPPEVLNRQLPDATVNSMAATYAHMVFSEDAIVHGMLQGKPPIYHSGGWDGKTSVAFPGDLPALGEWAKSVNMDLPAFQEYAKAVRESVYGYLDNVSEGDLSKKVQTPAGEQNGEWVLAIVLGTHTPAHAGEMAAVKGACGLKGLPF